MFPCVKPYMFHSDPLLSDCVMKLCQIVSSNIQPDAKSLFSLSPGLTPIESLTVSLYLAPSWSNEIRGHKHKICSTVHHE